MLIAAAAAMFAACQQEDVIIDQSSNLEKPISFGTYTPNMTRAENAENSSAKVKNGLESYHNTFRVWGYKNILTSSTDVYTNTKVFDGTDDKSVVTHGKSNYSPFTEDDDWVYAPVRYWDAAATNYEFHAAAPADKQTDGLLADAFWTWTETEIESGKTDGKGAGKFTTADFTVNGESLPFNTGVTGQTDDVFGKGTTKDVDLMIAQDVVEYTIFPTTNHIQLDFSHILSRLNIAVRTTLTSVYGQKNTKVTYNSSETELYTDGTDKYIKDAEGKAQKVTVTDGKATATGDDPADWSDSYTNVTEDDTTNPLAGVVKIDEVKVYNLNSKAKFDESKVTDATVLAKGTAARWTCETKTPKTYGFPNTEITADDVEEISKDVTVDGVTATNKNDLTGDYLYVYQGLVIPQNITWKDIKVDGSNLDASNDVYLKLVYSIDNETFSAYYNLADIFTARSQYKNANGIGAYKGKSVAGSDVKVYIDGKYYAEDGSEYTNYVFTDGEKYKDPAGNFLYYDATDKKFFIDENKGTEYEAQVIILTDKEWKKIPVMRAEVDGQGNITFCEGWQNTIKITIDPKAILFDADVYEWATKEDVDVTIQ